MEHLFAVNEFTQPRDNALPIKRVQGHYNNYTLLQLHTAAARSSSSSTTVVTLHTQLLYSLYVEQENEKYLGSPVRHLYCALLCGCSKPAAKQTDISS